MEYLHPLAVQDLEFLPYRLRQDDVGGDSCTGSVRMIWSSCPTGIPCACM
ncbi:MAG: hypothetical protein ACLR8Y_20030 [Alistipes indistinctus]